ncbi:MAG: hypothetical protein U9R32_05430 [Bacteroidota bacterium]|nr:hypothetical protein [Bacteroidota bacterium]
MTKKVLLFFVLAGMMIFSSCSSTIHTAKVFKRMKQKHQKVAVLPFDISISSGSRATTGNVLFRKNEKETAMFLQQEITKKLIEKKDKYSLTVLDAEKVNKILEENNISYFDIYHRDIKELGMLLRVDAVVTGKIISPKRITPDAVNNKDAADVKVKVVISDIFMKKEMWRYEENISFKNAGNRKGLTEIIEKKLVKKFPYK